MACIPKTLAEHLSKKGDLFRYDELIGSVIQTSSTSDLMQKRLKSQFFDIFGAKDSMGFSANQGKLIEQLLGKIK